MPDRGLVCNAAPGVVEESVRTAVERNEFALIPSGVHGLAKRYR